MHKTTIPAGEPQRWHYKHHVEACYCISGKGTLTSEVTGERWDIGPDTVYAPDENDPHVFHALEDTVLICVFSPALAGDELHDADGSYPAAPQSNGFRSPVYDVRPVPIEKVKANDYNPNRVAPPEMELLRVSIEADGYTQPVVAVHDRDADEYVVVDGFHRYLTLRDNAELLEREQGMLPVVVINKAMGDRMASTIRHNRARGAHNVELMSTIVGELVEMGKGDAWICKHIGMSKDELLRMKQVTGVAALFADRDFSASWTADSDVVPEDEEFEAAV